MEKTLRSFYGGSNADLGPVNMDPPPQINDYLRWTGAYWAPASFEESEKNLTETVRNAGFTMLPKGTPVRIVGNTGQEANVIAANATDSFPAHLVLNQNLLAGASGEAVAIGFINNVSVPDASIFTGGQEVYLGPTGGWTTTRPTGTNKIQKLGTIVKPNTGANTVSGIINIANIQDLPNLSEGRVWIGNSSGLAEEFNLTSELSSNRNRANHTGTQAWNTITGTPTTTAGYGITDAAFNGQIINGVAHFVQNTAPTSRINAAGQNIGALVAGDRWAKSDDGTDWFWNGTYWLSVIERILGTVACNNLTVTTSLGIIESKAPVITSESMNANQMNIFTTRCLFHSRGMETNDESNYWTCVIGAQNGFGFTPGLFPAPPTVDTVGLTSHGGYGRRKDTAINQLQTAIPYNLVATVTKVGSPSNLIGHFVYFYRTVYI